MESKGFFLAAIFAAVLCTSGHVLAALSGGGTEASPYLIQSRADFDEFANPANATTYWASGVYTKLMCDPNLADTTYTQAVIAPDTDSVTDGFQGTRFTGVFDGSGHTISNLTINQPTKDYIGLFGYMGTNGQVNNLGVENENITGRSYVSGLVGYNYQGTITSCYATGAVSGTSSSVGGLVGYNYQGTITSCHATGAVSGTSNVGGLAGRNFGSITSCYATGAVSGTGNYVGGLAGSNGNSITSCYATGAVSGTGNTVGGLVGVNYCPITSCFWDIQTSGQVGSSGGKGLTTEQMKTMSIYQNAGWADKGWVMNDGTDYPRLSWENTGGVPIPASEAIPLAGNGTAANPYLISTPQEFALLSWYADILNKHIRLTADLDLGGIAAYPIGDIGPFTGIFDGNGHTISNLTIAAPGQNYIGLFGYMGTNGQVNNLGVENENITGRSYVGWLVGYNYQGTITSCYATGTVSGTSSYVGGLAGYNYYGTITSCYATGAVSGSDYVGGLAGDNYQGTITSCHATGAVSGTGLWVGGLAGRNENGTITSCYATGAVSGTGNYVGGLAGMNNFGSITSCYATGAVSGTSYIGGLVGVNGEGGRITVSYATGAVSGTSSVGGLVGYNNPVFNVHNDQGTITFCYATGTVSGSGNYVGGLAGVNNYGTITSCYAIGAVSGTSSVGGLAGRNFGSITSCYATGAVSGTSYVGGLAGINDGRITSSFWDKETSGQTISAGGIGKTTAQMKDIQTYLDAGWLFIDENRTLGDWVMPEGSYPQLALQVYTPIVVPNLKGLTEQQAADALIAAGLLQGQRYWVYDTSVAAGLVSATIPQSGTTVYAGVTPVSILLAKDTKYAGGDGVTEPYRIETVEHLLDMSNSPADWNKWFILTADIDLTDLAFIQTVIAPDTNSSTSGFQGAQFTGVFDGSGHTISNLTVTAPGQDYIGLFGYVGTNGQVNNLGVENENITGCSYVGGLVGYNYQGTITTCYATGAVTGISDFVGGLAGRNYQGTITSCYATGAVSGTSYVGGLAGSNGSTITSCYATGAASGTSYVGGLVGNNSSGTLTSCYATGAASGTSYVGGLVGYNSGKIIRCYSAGKPTGTFYVGGLCGYKYISTGYEDTGNFWDTESSEISTSAMGTVKTTAQMQTLSTFTSADWDFDPNDGDAADWMMLRENEDYPRLAWQAIYPGDIAGLYGVDMEDLNVLIEYWLETWHVKADIVDDSIVNLMDLSVIGQNWMLTECGDCNGADITGDGNVDIQDTAVLADQWLFQENPDCQLADIDNSGTVDLADFSILAANWMMGI